MNRLELKFEISDINEKNLISNLKLTKEFNDRNITSIYYDTDLFKYYNDSEEGLTPRKKVRLRFYNENENKKNLEIKFTLANYRKKITFNNVSEPKIGEYLKKINIDDKKIKDEILNLKKTLMNLNFQKSSGQLEKTSKIKDTKKQIARLNTKLLNINGEKNA